jgi:hypothetical protein
MFRYPAFIGAAVFAYVKIKDWHLLFLAFFNFYPYTTATFVAHKMVHTILDGGIE